MKTNKILIGSGMITWLRMERVSNRYGAVFFHDADSEDRLKESGSRLNLPTIKTIVGKPGKLICEVTKTRTSTHIGDLFRGLFPTTPKMGAKITLGTGYLFLEKVEGQEIVGLCPPDGRTDDWLNPKALYKVHEQTVNLFFVEGGNHEN